MDGDIQPQADPGRTAISDSAVAKVAGLAARQVPGVHSLGAGPARALGAIRGAVVNSEHIAGVRAEVGATQVAVDIGLVALYGYRFQELASAVRAAVYAAVEDYVGLSVIEVNIEILDVQQGDSQRTTPAAPLAPVPSPAVVAREVEPPTAPEEPRPFTHAEDDASPKASTPDQENQS